MNEAKRRHLATWLRGSGIEIGALTSPLWVPSSASVRYVDRLPVDVQRRHYPEFADVELAPVDVCATAEDLSVIEDASVDFVIANHLLEHVEDPIAALCEFERVLERGGLVYLALPDRRLTFDRDREPTSVEHLLRDHDVGPAATRREHYLDWSRNVDKAQPADVDRHADELLAEGYSIHFHCWDPDSFLEFFAAVRQQVRLDLAMVAFAPPDGAHDDEFILLLEKGRSERRLRWRRRLASSPLGRPARAVKAAFRRRKARAATGD